MLASDWRLVTFFEGGAMAPIDLHRLFSEYDKHQTWRSKLTKRK